MDGYGISHDGGFKEAGRPRGSRARTSAVGRESHNQGTTWNAQQKDHQRGIKYLYERHFLPAPCV